MLIIDNELFEEWIKDQLEEADLNEDSTVFVRTIEEEDGDVDYELVIADDEDSAETYINEGLVEIGLSEDDEFVANADEEILNEFKASFGDPSSVPEPTGVRGKKRKADKADKHDAPIPQDPKGKAATIASVVKSLKEMDQDKLHEVYAKLVDEEVVNEDDYEDEETFTESAKKITAEDINVTEDMSAMFSGSSDLSEDFKSKATTIFEAAVVSKVNEIVEKIVTENETDREVAKTEIAEEMETRLNEYLDYVVDEWMKENEIAIENGIKNQITEDMLSAMKNVFNEHYIDIPEEKIDIVEEVTAHAEELQTSLDEAIESNALLFNKIKDFEKEKAFAIVAEDLSDSEADKLLSLSGGVEFTTEEEYAEKLNIIKENYFKSDDDNRTVLSEVVVSDDGDDVIELDEGVEEKVLTPAMNAYVNTLRSHVK